MSVISEIRRRLILMRHGHTAAAQYAGVSVGENSRVFSQHFGTEPWLISIGARTTVSSNVTFLTHDGIGELYKDQLGRRYRYAPISVGDDSFVGLGVIILPGVDIGSRCVVAAGSVVTRSVEDGSVVGGNPARMITTYDELMSRVRLWPSDSDRRGRDYRNFVNQVVMTKGE